MQKLMTFFTLLMISSTVFAVDNEQKVSSFSGESATRLFRAIGGSMAQFEGLIAVAGTGEVDCDALYNFCAVIGEQNTLNQAMGAQGSRLVNALSKAGVPLKVKSIACDSRVVAVAKGNNQKQLVELNNCTVKY